MLVLFLVKLLSPGPESLAPQLTNIINTQMPTLILVPRRRHIGNWTVRQVIVPIDTHLLTWSRWSIRSSVAGWPKTVDAVRRCIQQARSVSKRIGQCSAHSALRSFWILRTVFTAIPALGGRLAQR